MIARCSCGGVEYEATGRPIVSFICFCTDCQTGSKQLEALPGAGSVRDCDGGTAYVVYRKDRIRCARGAELLDHHKLRADTVTSRVTARCCNDPMVMWFEGARHWVPVYRARIADAPVAEMRVCTNSAPAGFPPPNLPSSDLSSSDIPSYAGFPIKLLAKLLAARLAMLGGRSASS